MAALAKRERFNPDSSIAQEGKPGDDFYVVTSGQAKVIRRGKTVDRLRPGDFFGEIALLDEGPRTASIVTETPVEVLSLNRKPFQALLKREPTIVLKMMEELAGRLRGVERSLSE
jgi:CRP-like cAMP-binding protein